MTVGFNDLSAEALQGVRLWLEQNPPAIGINNILGYSQFLASLQLAVVLTQETTTSATYTDLATVGPTISGLPRGKYLVLFRSDGGGSDSTPGTPGYAYVSVKYSTDEASDDDRAECLLQGLTGGFVNKSECMGFLGVDLTGDQNTVTLRYRQTGHAGTSTAYFSNRQLLVLRYATL